MVNGAASGEYAEVSPVLEICAATRSPKESLQGSSAGFKSLLIPCIV